MEQLKTLFLNTILLVVAIKGKFSGLFFFFEEEEEEEEVAAKRNPPETS